MLKFDNLTIDFFRCFPSFNKLETFYEIEYDDDSRELSFYSNSRLRFIIDIDRAMIYFRRAMLNAEELKTVYKFLSTVDEIFKED